MTRFYSSVAVVTQLVSPCTEDAPTIIVESTAGYPVNFPFTIWVDQGTTNEELMEVTSASGNNWNVNRGIDGTPPTSHDAGATVAHAVSARDFREPQEHIADVDGVHGLNPTARVVGTDTTQTLSNKTLNSPVIHTPTVDGGSWSDATLATPTIANLSNAQHDHTTAAAGGAIPQNAVTGLDARLDAIEATNTTQDSEISSLQSTTTSLDSRTDALEAKVNPSSILTVGANDPTFWTGDVTLRRKGQWILARVDFTRQGSTWPQGDPGSFPAQNIPSGWRPPIDVFGAAALGTGMCRCTIDINGTVTVAFPDHDAPVGSHLVYTISYPAS